MKKKQISGVICMLLAGTLIFSACTGSKDPTPGTTEDGGAGSGSETPDDSNEGGLTPITPSDDVAQIWTDIETTIGQDNLNGSIELYADDISELYGIPAEDMKQFIGSVPMMNVVAQEFLIIEAQEGKADEIETALQARQQELDRQWSEYLPDQYALVQDARIVKNGNYLFFCVSEHADTAVRIFDAHTK